jgi:hypothetical protein
MPNPSERLRWLVHEFQAVVESLNESPSLKERKQLHLRMKILIDEMDGLIFTNLRVSRLVKIDSFPPDQDGAGPR